MSVTRSAVEVRGRIHAHSDWDYHGMRSRCLGMYDIYVDLDDKSITPHLIRDGFWESWVTAWTINTVKPGWTVLDIGANMGYYTFMYSKLVGDEGMIWAFEPMPRYVDSLRNSIDLNDTQNVFVYPVALSDSCGPTQLQVPGSLRGGASIVKNFTADGQQMEYFDVYRITLDSIPLPQLDFIKIDIEGAEREAWGGMQQTLAQNPGAVVTMEYAPCRYPDVKEWSQEILDQYHVTFIDVDAQEKPLDLEGMLAIEDLEMLVLRRRA